MQKGAEMKEYFETLSNTDLSFQEGFIKECVERGVDPEEMLKVAQFSITPSPGWTTPVGSNRGALANAGSAWTAPGRALGRGFQRMNPLGSMRSQAAVYNQPMPGAGFSQAAGSTAAGTSSADLRGIRRNVQAGKASQLERGMYSNVQRQAPAVPGKAAPAPINPTNPRGGMTAPTAVAAKSLSPTAIPAPAVAKTPAPVVAPTPAAVPTAQAAPAQRTTGVFQGNTPWSPGQSFTPKNLGTSPAGGGYAYGTRPTAAPMAAPQQPTQTPAVAQAAQPKPGLTYPAGHLVNQGKSFRKLSQTLDVDYLRKTAEKLWGKKAQAIDPIRNGVYANPKAMAVWGQVPPQEQQMQSAKMPVEGKPNMVGSGTAPAQQFKAQLAQAGQKPTQLDTPTY